MTMLPQRRLGRTNIVVSELGVGGYQFTGEFGVPRGEALAILDRAFTAGVTYVDTAPLYGSGESEELIGRALARFDGPIVLSTKLGCLFATIVRHGGDAAYQDEELLRRVFEHSLHLLRRDYVDVLMIHEPEWPVWGLDRATGEAPVMRVCEALKRDGLIGAIGLGGRDCDVMADLIETGRVDVVLTVLHYDLAVQDARDRLLPVAQKHGVGVIAGAPFRQGALAVRQDNAIAQMQQSGEYLHGFDADVIRRIRALYALSDEAGMDLIEMGIRYVLSDQRISTVIPGPRTVDQLDTNLAAAAKGPLPADLVERIDEIGHT